MKRIEVIDEIERLSSIVNSPGVSLASKAIINTIIEAQHNQLKAKLTNGKS